MAEEEEAAEALGLRGLQDRRDLPARLAPAVLKAVLAREVPPAPQGDVRCLDRGDFEDRRAQKEIRGRRGRPVPRGNAETADHRGLRDPQVHRFPAREDQPDQPARRALGAQPITDIFTT